MEMFKILPPLLSHASMRFRKDPLTLISSTGVADLQATVIRCSRSSLLESSGAMSGLLGGQGLIEPLLIHLFAYTVSK
jgi:hypothetical protein